MFDSVRKKLPAIDYVSIVRSVYNDERALLLGALASAIAAGATALKAQSTMLYAVSACFILVGVLRFFYMRAFWTENIDSQDADKAELWERRATIWGSIAGILYGFWCFVSLVLVDEPFAELASVSLSIAAMVGVVARNFGLDRLVTLQLTFVAVPMATGLFLAGDGYHTVLSVLLIAFVTSFRKLAGDVREILLNAVHGRVEASRLAIELDTALTTMHHGLCMLDENGRIAVFNNSARIAFMGQARENYIGRLFSEVVDEARAEGKLPPAAAECLLADVAQGLHGKSIISLHDDTQCEVTISTRQGHTVLMFEDITERVRADEKITFMARYDGLTQLANRAFFTEQVEARLMECAAADDHQAVMLMIIDIDDFKHVNDTLGHPIGDMLLMEAAERVRQIFGNSGHTARFGGDEFTVFRASEVSESQAAEDAKAIMAAMRVPFRIRGETLSVNVSVGTAIADCAESRLEELLTRADLALYHAKANGKAQWCLFHDQMDVEYRQRQRLRADVVEALDRDEFYLVYQPIVDIGTRRITGCEALVRWRHPELGVIPPVLFIPVAEETGAMARISAWVLETATQECASWPEPMTVSVNLSATDFRHNDVEAIVVRALKKSRLPAPRLIVEITETALIEEKDAAIATLGAVRRRGVGVALDDFGTGYSSLSYLHTLPFSKLKIDRSFVVDVVTNQRSRKLLANIARLSRDLDMTVTVEGIETEEQLAELVHTGNIDHAQGYLFGAPLPQKDMAEYFSRVAAPTASQGLATQRGVSSR